MCVLPFPSSFYLEEAVAGEGGGEERGRGTDFRVNFGPKTLPYTLGRTNIPPSALNGRDGFSTLAPILFYLEASSRLGFW